MFIYKDQFGYLDCISTAWGILDAGWQGIWNQAGTLESTWCCISSMFGTPGRRLVSDYGDVSSHVWKMPFSRKAFLLEAPGEPKGYQTVLKHLPKEARWDTWVPERSKRAPRAPDIEKTVVFLSFTATEKSASLVSGRIWHKPLPWTPSPSCYLDLFNVQCGL